MKNLWLFLVRYNSIFWFIVFFIAAIVLVVRNNNYQKSAFVNSSNVIVGSYYEKINSWKEYLSLAENNEQLLAENARLKRQLENLLAVDTAQSVILKDSIDLQRYDFITATVINNSIHQKSNFITLNKGSDAGIEPDMGVITSNGVVGIVEHVSKHFSTVRSLLHPDTKISVSLDSVSNAFGSLVWGNNIDARYAMVRDIPNHIKVKTGQAIFTSGFSSLFPKGIKVGHVVESDITSGESFKDIRILLTTDFATLQHVYVVHDKLALERIQLESSSEEHE